MRRITFFLCRYGMVDVELHGLGEWAAAELQAGNWSTKAGVTPHAPKHHKQERGNKEWDSTYARRVASRPTLGSDLLIVGNKHIKRRKLEALKSNHRAEKGEKPNPTTDYCSNAEGSGTRTPSRKLHAVTFISINHYIRRITLSRLLTAFSHSPS